MSGSRSVVYVYGINLFYSLVGGGACALIRLRLGLAGRAGVQSRAQLSPVASHSALSSFPLQPEN